MWLATQKHRYMLRSRTSVDIVFCCGIALLFVLGVVSFVERAIEVSVNDIFSE